MNDKIKVYISFRMNQRSKHLGEYFYSWLMDEGFAVFIVQSVEPGKEWRQEIYKQVKECEVLLVLLEQDSHLSEWVRREVDIARGANISILPIRIAGNDTRQAMEALSLEEVHYFTYSGDESLPQLKKLIEKLADVTRSNRGQNISSTEFEKMGLKFFEALKALEQQNSREEGIRVNPIFGIPANSQQFQCDIFVIMPFADEFKPVYKLLIKSLEKDTDLKLTKGIKRGDDFFSHHNIMDEIWSALNACKIVIADCTGRNANVFYELGIAHTLGKPYILITQQVKDAPFDIVGRRLIEYTNSIDGADKLKDDLKKAILALMSELDGAET